MRSSWWWMSVFGRGAPRRGVAQARPGRRAGRTGRTAGRRRSARRWRRRRSAPSSMPIAVAATMNGSDVACRSAGDRRARGAEQRRGRAARAARARRAARRGTAGPSSSVEAPASSASRSNRTPLVTKKTGMKKPKPIASSLRRKSGCVITSSRSTSESIAPARNAPRMTSRPSASASAANADEQHERAADADLRGRVLQAQEVGADARASARRRAATTSTTAASANSAPSSSSVDADPALAGEEQRQQDDRAEVGDRRGGDDQLPERASEISPASLSTGTSTPSDVAHRMIATSSGVSTSPPACERRARRRRAIANESDEAEPRRAAATGRAAASKSISRPARKSRNASPISATPRRLVDLDQAEHRRADDDPRDDLQHDRRQPYAREEAEQRAARANATATTRRRSSNEGMRRSRLPPAFVTRTWWPDAPGARRRRRCRPSRCRTRSARRSSGSRQRRAVRPGEVGVDAVAARTDQYSAWPL